MRFQYDWRVAIGFTLLLLTVAAFLFRETFSYLTTIWSHVEEGEYGHGYVVVAISLYLIYLQIPKLRQMSPHIDARGIVAIMLSGFTWLLASLANVEMLQAFAMLMMLMSIVWTTLGLSVFKACVFAIGFLIYAIPVWFPLSPPLQEWTADFVFAVLRSIGVPAFREDNFIVLPAGTISIEEACSGLRYLLAALTLGTLYAQLYFKDARKRIMVIMIAAAAAIAANFIRVLIIVYLAYVTDMQHPLVADHLSLGWYVFGVILFILLALDTWAHRGKQGESEDAETAKVVERPAAVARLSGAQLIVYVLAMLSLVAAPWWHDRITTDLDQAASAPAPVLADRLGEWISTGADAAPGWTPVFKGSTISKKSYRMQDNVIIFAEAFYNRQEQGKELISYLNELYQRSDWRSTYSFAKTLTLDKGVVLEKSIQNKRNSSRYLIWYWYEIAGRTTINKYMAKIYQVTGLLTGTTTASARIIAVRVRDDVDSAREDIQEFYNVYRDHQTR